MHFCSVVVFHLVVILSISVTRPTATCNSHRMGQSVSVNGHKIIDGMAKKRVVNVLLYWVPIYWNNVSKTFVISVNKYEEMYGNNKIYLNCRTRKNIIVNSGRGRRTREKSTQRERERKTMIELNFVQWKCVKTKLWVHKQEQVIHTHDGNSMAPPRTPNTSTRYSNWQRIRRTKNKSQRNTCDKASMNTKSRNSSGYAIVYKRRNQNQKFWMKCDTIFFRESND